MLMMCNSCIVRSSMFPIGDGDIFFSIFRNGKIEILELIISIVLPFEHNVCKCKSTTFLLQAFLDLDPVKNAL